MTRTKSTHLALLAVLLSPMTANADVIYEFSAFSSFEFNGERILSAEFSIITSDFVTSDTTFLLTDMLSCFVVSSLGTNQCGAETFIRLDQNPGFENLNFGAILGGEFIDVFYVFDDGAFGAEGTYQTQVFGEIQRGELVVSVISVPEPGTLALLGIGLFGMGLSRRRKKI